MNRKDIITVIKETAELSGACSFDHGTIAYANIEDSKFPRTWLYPYVLKPVILSSGALQQHIEVMLDFLKLSDLNDSTTDLSVIIQEMQLMALQFILRLSRHPQIKSIKEIIIEPMYHLFDSECSGVGMTFTCEFIGEVTYPC